MKQLLLTENIFERYANPKCTKCLGTGRAGYNENHNPIPCGKCVRRDSRYQRLLARGDKGSVYVERVKY